MKKKTSEVLTLLIGIAAIFVLGMIIGRVMTIAKQEKSYKIVEAVAQQVIENCQREVSRLENEIDYMTDKLVDTTEEKNRCAAINNDLTRKLKNREE